jgi:hypothetical protein
MGVAERREMTKENRGVTYSKNEIGHEGDPSAIMH